jgi:hypothetical protein
MMAGTIPYNMQDNYIPKEKWNIAERSMHGDRSQKTTERVSKTGISIAEVAAGILWQSPAPGKRTGVRDTGVFPKFSDNNCQRNREWYFLKVLERRTGPHILIPLVIRPVLDADGGAILRQVSGKNNKRVETLALTLEGRGNDLVVCTRCFCCSQVFSVLYCKYQC